MESLPNLPEDDLGPDEDQWSDDAAAEWDQQIEQGTTMMLQESSATDVRVLGILDVLKRLPKLIGQTKGLLDIDDDDKIICILQHFKWNK